MITTLVQKVNVISSNGSAQNIGKLLIKCGYKKPLVVCDNGLANLDFVRNILDQIKKDGLDYCLYSDVYPNPEDDLVENGLKKCLENMCDSVLAIGGGSSIDTAKCINLMRFNDGSILDYEGKQPKDCYGFFSIPTTAGTGSELSQGAIISDRQTHRKKLIPTDCFKEEYTILDALLTCGLSKKQTAYTGLDVFSHAAEAYTATKATPIVDLICEKIMETVVEYLPLAVENGQNIKARERMLNAASLGGWVLMCSSDHLGHAVAHIIGAEFNMIHGQACMYGFPAMINFIFDKLPGKIAQIGRILKADIKEDDNAETIKNKTIEAYEAFCNSLTVVDNDHLNCEDSRVKEMSTELVSNPFLEMCPKKVDFVAAEKIIRESLR
ncbi:MAG: iron-containing alcohol dehydrogenase [Erysipelotrichia bacterium]|nr:iron-containing alcohol dehydrogenase [Erysipelotrichia bacterium]